MKYRENCASCSLFIQCKDQNRSSNYICNKYRPFTQAQLEIMGRGSEDEARQVLLDLEEAAKVDLGTETVQVLDMITMLDQAMSSANAISPDLRIDDRDLKEYPNFWSFCCDPKGLNQPPFAKQLVLFTHLLNEWCVAGDTLIQTNQGLLKIQDLQGKSNKYSTLNGVKIVAKNGTRSIADAGMTSASQKVLLIEDANGHRLRCTPKHRIQVLTRNLKLEWKEAQELKLGDYLVSTIGANLWPKSPAKLRAGYKSIYNHPNAKRWSFSPPERVTPELARLTGYLLADGHINEYSIGFTNTDKALVDDFIHCVRKIFGQSVEIILTKGNPISKAGTVCRITYEIKENYSVLTRWLHHIGLPACICYDKELPNYILQSDKETVIECLRAIIDCGGWIQPTRIGIKLSSTLLIQQMSLLLDNMGIYNQVQYIQRNTTKYGRENIHSHENAELNIRANYVALYKELIGSRHSIKKRVKHKVHKSKHVRYSPRVRPGKIPFGDKILKILKKGLETYNETWPKPSFHRAKTWNLDSISEELLQWCDTKKLKLGNRLRYLRDKRFAFAEVIKIEAQLEEIPVYDVRVPVGENFQANGIIIHNCPKCSHKMFHDPREFPTDYPVMEAKEHVTFLEYGVCPKCGSTRSELTRSEQLKDPQDLVLCAGQRSGKSIGLSLVNAYLIHKWLKAQNLTKLYRQTLNTTFTDTLVALTFIRAKALLYTPLIDMMNSSVWFQSYFEMLRSYEDKYDEELLIIGKESIAFKHRQLVIHPMNPSKRTLRGDTRVKSSVDELGWFPYGEGSDERERASASEVYEALDNSMGTVREAYEQRIKEGFNNVYNAYGIFTSSPQAYNDQIMSMLRSYQHSRYAVTGHFATWEMNPRFTRKTSFIVKKYQNNPVKAERDFGANPPLADSPYIPDVMEYIHCFSKKRANMLGGYGYVTHPASTGHRRYAKFQKLEPMPGPSIMAIDAGFRHNSFAMMVGQLDRNNIPQVYGAVEIAPTHNKPLDFSKIYEHIIMPTIKMCNVVRVYCDRWSSHKLLHDIEADTSKEGLQNRVEGVQYSLRRDDFDYVMDFMSDRKKAPQFPALEIKYDEIMNKEADKYPHSFKYQPWAHLLFQMATVRETARTVDKGHGYTDDLFRALILLLSHLYYEEVQEWLKTKLVGAVAAKPALFSAASLSGGGRISTGGTGLYIGSSSSSSPGKSLIIASKGMNSR